MKLKVKPHTWYKRRDGLAVKTHVAGEHVKGVFFFHVYAQNGDFVGSVWEDGSVYLDREDDWDLVETICKPVVTQAEPKDKPTESRPPHYANLKIQPDDYIVDNGLGWHEGQAVKYITRWKAKGGVEDLKKAIANINRLIERETK